MGACGRQIHIGGSVYHVSHFDVVNLVESLDGERMHSAYQKTSYSTYSKCKTTRG